MSDRLTPERLTVIRADIGACRNYNFGMYRADRLAHEGAPALLAEVERLAPWETLDAVTRAVARVTPCSCSAQRARADAAEAEAERLGHWKAEALPVMAGLQDLGAALGVGLGQRITGEAAAERAHALVAQVERLTAERDAARAEVARLRAEAEPIDPGLLRKWLAASDAARASEHHFPADCLAEAIDTVQHIATRAEAAERELAALREAVEDFAAHMDGAARGGQGRIACREVAQVLRAALTTPSKTEEGR